MTKIRLYNTKTRKKEVFAPLDDQNVRMYVCGPTVYDRAHLGNARPVVVFDVLYRLLRHVYGEVHVSYVRNFTDVDDKIIARAAESGRDIGEITAETTQWYLEDMAAVGALEPNEMPRATEYVPHMVAMIEGLSARGFAYHCDGHVMFRVRKYKEYGALSGRSVDDMIAGARVEVAPYKEDPLDFVLWKPSNEDQPGWEGPVVGGAQVGRGRPGWHIECSAMALDLLGAEFDIHGGGNDLQFPHHENEIAQSACMGHGFANVWLHNEMLQVEGKKMSKSLGNFFTVRDLLDQGVPGEVIRWMLLKTHYRRPIDWTKRGVKEAKRELASFYEFDPELMTGSDERIAEPVRAALCDDLNMPKAIAALHEMRNSLNFHDLSPTMRALGFTGTWAMPSEPELSYATIIELIVSDMDEARKFRDYERADKIRVLLVDAGVEIGSKGGETQWKFTAEFDSAKIEALK